MSGWAMVGVFAGPVLLAGMWSIWQVNIHPLFIDRCEIDDLAAEYMARYGERAEEMVFINEDRAWRYSEEFEQGKWRRVRKTIRKRRIAPVSENLR